MQGTLPPMSKKEQLALQLKQARLNLTHAPYYAWTSQIYLVKNMSMGVQYEFSLGLHRPPVSSRRVACQVSAPWRQVMYFCTRRPMLGVFSIYISY